MNEQEQLKEIIKQLKFRMEMDFDLSCTDRDCILIIINNLEKQVPKKPINGSLCPTCGDKVELDDYYVLDYCNGCGQKIEGSE